MIHSRAAPSYRERLGVSISSLRSQQHVEKPICAKRRKRHSEFSKMKRRRAAGPTLMKKKKKAAKKKKAKFLSSKNAGESQQENSIGINDKSVNCLPSPDYWKERSNKLWTRFFIIYVGVGILFLIFSSLSLNRTHGYSDSDNSIVAINPKNESTLLHNGQSEVSNGTKEAEITFGSQLLDVIWNATDPAATSCLIPYCTDSEQTEDNNTFLLLLIYSEFLLISFSVSNSTKSSTDDINLESLDQLSHSNSSDDETDEDIDNNNIESTESDCIAESSEISMSDYNYYENESNYNGCSEEYDESGTESAHESHSITIDEISSDIGSWEDDEQVTPSGLLTDEACPWSLWNVSGLTLISGFKTGSVDFFCSEKNDTTNDQVTLVNTYCEPSDSCLNWDRLTNELLKITESEDDN